MTPNLPSYESTFAYLTIESYNGGMEPYYDFLRLFTALVQTDGGLPTGERLAQLVYHLNDEQRRWLKLCAEVANGLDDAAITATISEEQFHAQKTRRFGSSNPELMDMPFWVFMVQRRWNAYQGRKQFDTAFRQHMEAYSARRVREEAGEDVSNIILPPHPGYYSPTWCFDRFGMSNTRLPDGRVLFIAGEHEDYYDADFCIYNEVIVLDYNLEVTIYGYPKEVFPPTDFHTATLVGKNQLYLIGSLGYIEDRQPGYTPIYVLDTTTMQISKIETSGKPPGWISNHSAEYFPDRNAIEVTGGKVFTSQGRKKSYKDNTRTFWLDLTTLAWSSGKLPIKVSK